MSPDPSLASTLTLPQAGLCPDLESQSDTKSLSQPLENITPHDDLWFEDGNLIIVAQDVGFRVYRGLLSQQSTVFRDMFSIGLGENDEENFDGYPIVRLVDSPQEVAHLFRVLLPKSWGRLHPKKGERKLTFDEVAARARLSHKYHIPDIEEQSLDLLRQRFTDSFDQWYQTSSLPIFFSHIHAIGVVNIARLTNTPSMLPSALYCCCKLGPELLDGWNRGDGHVEYLALDDLKICFAARETLCKEGAQVFFKIFHDQPSEECSRATQCRAALAAMVQSLMKSALSSAIECSVLFRWKSIIDARVATHGICAACTKELHARDEKARREAWDRLPDIFGISVPGWGTKVGQRAAVAA